MKKQEISFLGPDAIARRSQETTMKSFDWNKAAEIIKENLAKYPNLIASAGLQGDWAYTGGEIFENGKPTNDNYTYLSSNWAIPTLIIENDGEEILEVACYEDENKFDSSSKWDKESLEILGINL